MGDYLIKAIDRLGRIRVYVAVTTETVDKMRKIHGCSATATAAMGRVLTGVSMLSSTLKNKSDIYTMTISGNGPIGKIVAVGHTNGKVKITADYPEIDVHSRSDGKLDVGTIVGREGRLTVVQDLGLKEPYVGTCPLVSGEIGEDIANYFRVSEQINSAVGLGVMVEKDLSVSASGGFIVQLLPLINEEEIDKLEEMLKSLKSITELLKNGKKPEQILEELFKDFDMEILDKVDIEYECDCSKAKIEKVLLSLGKYELNNIIEEDGKAEVKCHFCNKLYNFDKKELSELREKAQ